MLLVMLPHGLQPALDLHRGGGRIHPAKGYEEQGGGGPESNGGEEGPPRIVEGAAAHVLR